jgi:hypothetical protein
MPESGFAGRAVAPRHGLRRTEEPEEPEPEEPDRSARKPWHEQIPETKKARIRE